jgi:hypothetical protein
MIKRLLSILLNSNNVSLFKHFWKIHNLFKKNNTLWIDHSGNTLAHYACMHHSSELFDLALKHQINLKHLNNKGQAPIHIFIERSFFEQGTKGDLRTFSKELLYNFLFFLNRIFVLPKNFLEYIDNHREIFDKKILNISYNENLLDLLIKNGADINQFMEFPDKKELGWNSTDYGAFALKDNMGSPIELLVYFYWVFILYPYVDRDVSEIQPQYEAYFHKLTSYGANINTIVAGNKNESYIQDVMESFPTRLMSIFFCKFIVNAREYLAIKPILEDENLDFLQVDDLGNTILHTLFARLSARKEKITEDVCEEIIMGVANNKKLTVEALELKNTYDMSPLELVRGDAEHFRQHLLSFILNKQLQAQLSHKKETKKVVKI